MSGYNKFPEGMNPIDNPAMKKYEGEASTGWSFGDFFKRSTPVSSEVQTLNRLSQSLTTIVEGLSVEQDISKLKDTIEWVWIENIEANKLGNRIKTDTVFSDAEIRFYYLRAKPELYDVRVEHQAYSNKGHVKPNYYAIYGVYRDLELHFEKVRYAKNSHNKSLSKRQPKKFKK